MESFEPQVNESLLADIVDEFTDRCHRGEAASVEDYAARHPALGTILRQVLPAIANLANHSTRMQDDRNPASNSTGAPTNEQAERDTERMASVVASSSWPNLSGYEILGEIGSGGMGMVYKARHLQLDRIVAIKVMRDNSTAAVSERLAREARLLAKIHHPHIVQIFELGQYEDCSFLALEYCAGGSLAEHVVGEPQPPRWAAEVTLKLADALHAAHGAGLIHRDLKPANVLLAADGAPKIADFGLARLLGVDQDQTRSGMILGTPCYMAPEQTRGDRALVTTAADIYALGATLYELLVGRPPFKGTSFFETLEQVRRDKPVPPRKLQPGIPRDLEKICLKCLRKAPSARYRSAEELANDLRRFLKSPPSEASPANAAARLVQSVRLNPFATLLVATNLVLLAGGLSSKTLLFRDAPAHSHTTESPAHADGTAEDAAGKARPARATQNSASPQRFESLLAQARAGRKAGRLGQRFHGLASLTEAASILSELGLDETARREVRNEAIACMGLIDLRVDRHWTEPNADPSHVRVRMDGKLEHYARLEQDGRVVVRRMDNNAEVRGFPGLDNIFYKQPLAVLSPDGRYLAIKGGPISAQLEVQLWDLMNNQELLACPAGGTWERNWHDRALAFSHDSRQFAYVGEGGSVRIFDVKLRRESARIPMPEMPYTFSFRPDGKQLAATQRGDAGGVFVVRLLDGVIERTLAHPTSVHGTDWSPDGKWLAVACGDGRVYVWNVVTGEKLRTSKGHRDNTIHVAFNHAGDLLASAGWDSVTRLWDPRTGESLLVADLRGTQFSRDDQWLAFNFSGVATGRWEVATARECRVLVTPNGKSPIASLTFSPDGRILASSSRRGDGYRLWSATDGRELAFIPGSGIAEWHSVLFEPTGKGLLTVDSKVRRWPLETTPEGLRLGAPEQPVELPADGQPANLSVSLDQAARTLVLTNREQGAVVWDYAKRKPLVTMDEDRKIQWAEISPNGKWIATSAPFGPGVELWNVGRRRVEKSLSLGGARAVFSPDNGQLVLSRGSHIEVREVGTWKELPALTKKIAGFAAVAYSADMRLLAIVRRDDVLLCDANTGEDLAKLTPPRVAQLAAGDADGVGIAFSPEGTQLAVGSQQGLIFLWDLALIREQLAAMHLDWDHPPLRSTGSRAEDLADGRP